MWRPKTLWSGAALLCLLAAFLLSRAARANPVTLTDLLIGGGAVSGYTNGSDGAVGGMTKGPMDTVGAVPDVGASPVVISPKAQPATRECVYGKDLVGEFRTKVLAAEKRILAPGWVYDHTKEDYFQVAGKKLADGRPVPTHQVGDVWFLLGEYVPQQGAFVIRMYSISKTSDPALTHWAYETSDVFYDLSLGIVTPLDEPPTVRFYTETLDMMLRGTLEACGGLQVGNWQGKKVYIFTKREQYREPFKVGKGESAKNLFGSGYRLYFDFATGVPVGDEDFRLDAEGKEVLARRVVERWDRQVPPREIVEQFQDRLQKVER